MASRSAKVSIERRRAGDSMNDNYPSVLPGHELKGLDGLPRPPAAEAVVHYSRVTQIGSFPAHPTQLPSEADEPPAMDALPDRAHHVLLGSKKRVAFASLASCVFHAALLAALLVTMVAVPEDPQEEAGDTVSVIMLGSSDMDQMSAGEESKEPSPEPEQVVAEAVQPQTVQPTETEPTEAESVQPQQVEVQPQQTVQAETSIPDTVDGVQPSQEVQQVAPETVVTPEPEILATQSPAETSVVQPMAAAVAQEVPPVETQPAEAQPVQPVERVEPPPETTMPIAKPIERPKAIEKPKEVVKKPAPKAAKVKAGSNGENQDDSKKGSTDGSETAQSDQNSQSNARRSGAGSAAVANYPGKVQARIRRAVRVSSKYEKGLTVRVSLTIASSGGLSSLSVSRSSGIPELDQAVVDGIRRAAPFPPLPAEWGKPSWSFSQELQVTGR